MASSSKKKKTTGKGPVKKASGKTAKKRKLSSKIAQRSSKLISKGIKKRKSSSIAITPTDPTLQAYMREVNRVPLLAREEEHALAVSFYENKDKEAFQKLVTANLRFVVKIAYEYVHYRLRLLDLIQEGNMGLVKAVQQFDPYKGVKLTTYAVWWIRSYIQDFILKNYSLVKIGTTQAQKKLFYRLRREQAELERQGITGPKSVQLLASKFDVKEDEVEQMSQRMGSRDLSLNAPTNAEEKTEHLDRLTSGEESFVTSMGETEQLVQFKEILKEFGKSLEGREKDIFEKRLTSEQPVTLQEIGDKFNVSKERARQLEEQIKLRLRQYIKEKYPEYDLE